MFKCLGRLVFLGVLGLVGLYFVGAYHVVHSTQGWHMIKKEKWTFSDTFLDTRDWGWVDFLKNPRVASELGKARMEQWKEQAKGLWNDVLDTKNEWLEDLDEVDRKAVEDNLNRIKEQFENKAKELQETMEKQDWDTEKMEKKMQELNQWAQQELKRLQDKWQEN